MIVEILRTFKSRGKTNGADKDLIVENVPDLIKKLKSFAENDNFNSNGFGAFYSMHRDKTVAEKPLSGRKKSKLSFTKLVFCNGNGSEKYILMYIGYSVQPRALNKKYGLELGFYCRHNRKA